MKTLVAFFVAVALTGFLIGALRSEETGQMSPEALEKLAKEAVKTSLEARQELGKKFLPKPETLGSGWLLPWQLPPSVRKCASEDEYWQSISGAFDKDDKAFFGGLISVLLEFSPKELDAFLNTWITMATKEMRPSEVPAGLTPEQFCLAPLLLMLRWEFSPSLAKKMDLVTGYLEDMQKVLAEMAERRFGAAGVTNASPMRTERDVMNELVAKPVKGMSEQDLRKEILQWAAAVKSATAMTYTKCDDWNALQSGDEAALRNVHLRHVVVTVTVLDRSAMPRMIDDLKPNEAADLQRRFNARVGKFRDFSVEVLEKQRTAELKKKLEEETNPERKSEIQQELAKLPEVIAKFKETMPRVDFEVYTRDFGDNCYVINMKGDFKLPELSFPATNLQSCLRNGNAVVFIGLGGNYTPEQLKKELDLFLSEMDARTAFFRE